MRVETGRPLPRPRTSALRKIDGLQRVVDIGDVDDCIHGGIAFARLAADYQDADRMRIEGSPTFVLNDGRQKPYGNIAFRLMEANVRELLRAPRIEHASWC